MAYQCAVRVLRVSRAACSGDGGVGISAKMAEIAGDSAAVRAGALDSGRGRRNIRRHTGGLARAGAGAPLAKRHPRIQGYTGVRL